MIPQGLLRAAPSLYRAIPTRSTLLPRAYTLHRRALATIKKSRVEDPSQHPALATKPSREKNFGQRRFADFDLAGKTFVVTGGAQGLGLATAEGLCEAGGKDVQDDKGLDSLITSIADENKGIDGVVATAGVQQLCLAVEYKAEDVSRMLAINYTGVMMTATAVARQMLKYKNRGSICLIASISGRQANKGLISPVYNSSKAAVIQLARNLAMEWSPIREDGTGGIRVNCISPGHIVTPMVQKNFEEVAGLREEWEKNIMMGRLADPWEFKGAALFLLSNASSFMTGSNMIIDGGQNSW